MNEPNHVTNRTVIQLSDGKTIFATDKGQWEMGLIETVAAVHKAIANATSMDAHIPIVKQLVIEAGGPVLNDDQADEFWLRLTEAYLRKKKYWRDTFSHIQGLPDSTESIPSESETTG